MDPEATNTFFMNCSQYLGESTEMLVTSMLLADLRDTYLPAVDDHGVDIIVRTKEFQPGDGSKAEHYEYQELQVKSASAKGLFAPLKCPNPRPNYWFVFYIRDINRMWLVNSQDLVRLSSRVTKPGAKAFGTYTFDLTPVKRTPIKHPEFLITDFSSLP